MPSNSQLCPTSQSTQKTKTNPTKQPNRLKMLLIAIALFAVWSNIIIFSSTDAALQVLMSVCLSPILNSASFHGFLLPHYPRLPKVTKDSFHAVT